MKPKSKVVLKSKSTTSKAVHKVYKVESEDEEIDDLIPLEDQEEEQYRTTSGLVFKKEKEKEKKDKSKKERKEKKKEKEEKRKVKKEKDKIINSSSGFANMSFDDNIEENIRL